MNGTRVARLGAGYTRLAGHPPRPAIAVIANEGKPREFITWRYANKYFPVPVYEVNGYSRHNEFRAFKKAYKRARAKGLTRV